jgi:hypothetical protein
MAEPIFKTIDGVDILLDPNDGRFRAKIGERWVTRKSLSDIEREIAKLTRPTYGKGILVTETWYNRRPQPPAIQVVDIIEYVRSSRHWRVRFENGYVGLVKDYAARLYLYDEAQLANLTALQARVAEALDTWHQAELLLDTPDPDAKQGQSDV